jgi:hypothetical protein
MALHTLMAYVMAVLLCGYPGIAIWASLPKLARPKYIIVKWLGRLYCYTIQVLLVRIALDYKCDVRFAGYQLPSLYFP